jgi:acetyltransferase-like isoleucine patch superfamily enzyme
VRRTSRGLLARTLPVRRDASGRGARRRTRLLWRRVRGISASRLVRALRRAKVRALRAVGLRPELKHLTMGRCSYGDPAVMVYKGDLAMAHIGAFVSIANDVVLVVGGNHRVDWVSTFPFRAILDMSGAFQDGHPATKGDIVIGNDVWIARGATVLSGVHVGNGAVIGAEAVVTQDVRPFAIVVGNPAREVRRRFTDAQVDALQRISWWDWPMVKVRDAVPMLSDGAIDDFIARFDPGPAN